ncbi:hypothetical protein [Clostridioides sp. ZZV15-6388]|uniref:hypothetical protein n=1 Tax=unclassified Clostridioides TaxID=2635829 RepID=UPI001D12E33B|nr:hypothetical protein [Clostridioides sp. ZZV15-6388]MCC0664487.1 hypothetical protein [Clostridioides sp. ZZV15-6597]
MKSKKKPKFLLISTLVIITMLSTGATALEIHTSSQIHSDIRNRGNFNTSANSKVGADSQKSSNSLPHNAQSLNVFLDICNGGVEILPTSSNKIIANYNSQYYNIKMTKQNGKWVISISGKTAKMGNSSYVQLHIPNIKCNMDVNVLDGSFSYDFPENCIDAINVTAKDSSIEFTSKNQYKNSTISLSATDKEFLEYGLINYPDYFTKTHKGFEYKNGTIKNQIDISLTGFTNVDFRD